MKLSFLLLIPSKQKYGVVSLLTVRCRAAVHSVYAVLRSHGAIQEI